MEKKKILVVDDEQIVTDFTKRVLDREGYDTTVAYDGRQALEIIKETRPDLILLDIMMPQMDGFKVLKELKQNDNTKSIPVIIVSAKEEPETIVKSMVEHGAVDYLVKPFFFDNVAESPTEEKPVSNDSELMKKIRKWLKQD